MKSFLLPLALFLAFTASAVQASELDPGTPGSPVPQGLIVRINADGVADVFRAAGTESVTDQTSAAAAAAVFVQPANQIQNVKPLSELDKVSSDGACYYWPRYGFNRGYGGYGNGFGCGNNYGYYWGGYNYYYNPCYNWYSGGYNYYYYYYYNRY
jgi:hypothetical protein